MNQLRSWKTKMEKKFELSERVRKDLEQSTEEAKKTLEVKEKDLKDGLRQAKEVVVREYRDSYTLLSELGDSFLQGFDETLHQVKKAYPNLDITNIKVEDQAQTSVMPVASEDTDDLTTKFLATGSQPKLSPSQSQPISLSQRQPFSLSRKQSNRKILQLQISCVYLLFIIIFSFFFFFSSVFFVFGEQFHPSWRIYKHYFFKGLLIFRHVNSFVECIHLIFSYIYIYMGIRPLCGPFILWGGLVLLGVRPLCGL